MNMVFADAGYWIALLYPDDALHNAASDLHRWIESRKIQVVTSEMVLTEFLNFFCKKNEKVRQQAVNTVTEMCQYTNFIVVPQTSELFTRSVRLYAQRRDKQWSLTDCSSFLLMQDLNITDALAHDRHFEQAGFKALLKEELG